MKDEVNAEGAGPRDIVARTEAYAVQAVRLFQYLQTQPDRAGWILSKQYLRSATSIGANVAEAQNGESRADFVHKYAIAQKEANESRYWLRLLIRAELVATERVQPLLKETEELYAIIRRAKGR
jgi:four helix bundle protein